MQTPEISEQGKNQKTVLESKLRPPRLLKVLERPRLLELVSGGSPRMINVCAGPGFGKTTLMVQIAKEFSGSSIWYQVDNLDQDPAVLLRHLISGFSHACGYNGARAYSRLADVTDFSVESESVLAVLLDELSEYSQSPLLVCFDDFHLFNDSAHASSIVEYLVQNLPEHSCVALTTRRYPQLGFSRLRANGVLLDLGDDDLQFSLDELSSLTDTWEISATASTLEKVHKSTEGWPAGLVLSENFLRSGSDMPDLFSHRRIQQNVYEYLAEEVLNSQTGEMQELLIKAALIDPIDPAICEKALNVTPISEMLNEAEQGNLFTSRLDDTELYRFHPLFREFLQSRLLHSIGKDGTDDLRCRYAEAFTGAGQERQAIEQYLAARQYPQAIALIEDIGDEMLDTAEYATLEKWINAFKEEDLTPAIKIQKARILMSAGKFRKALGVLNTEKSSFAGSDIEQSSLCLLVKSECLRNLDKSEEAISILKSLMEISLPPSVRQQVLFQLCIVYWISDDQEGLQSSLDLALKDSDAVFSPTDIEIRIISCMQNLRMGNFIAAQRLLKDNLESGCLNESHINLHINNLASCLMMMGDYENAIIYAKKCKKRIEKHREFKLYGVACDTLGCLLIALGSETEGTKLMTSALERISNSEQIGEDISAALLCHLGSHARRKGELEAAIDFHTESIASADDFSGIYELAAGKANIGADLVRLEQFEEAEILFTNACNIAKKHNFLYVQTQVDFNRAWAAYVSRDEKLALSFLKLALVRAKKFKHNHYIIQEGKTTLPLFKVALEKGIEVEYTCWILKQIGEKSLSIIEPLLKHHDERLRERLAELLVDIGSLGAFSLLRRMRRDSNLRVQKLAKKSLTKLRKNIKSPIELLTPREAEVLECLSQGLTNSQIAQKLYIADCTVKTHVVKIYRKLGFSNRIDAIIYFQRNKE